MNDIIIWKCLLYFQHRHAEEDTERSPPARIGGAAIAPPPSLQESEPPSPPTPSLQIFEKPEKPIVVGGYGANSVAAKIMAKYGFKVSFYYTLI